MGEKNESISSSVEFDTTNAKVQISELNRQMRVLESGFRATAAGMEDWSKSATGLEARNSALNQQIDLQRQKVAGLSKVYEELAADEKTTAKEKEEMQIKINRETETLGKLETELRGNQKALSEMGNESKDTGNKVKGLGEEEEKTAGKSEKFKAVLSGLGSGIKTLGLAAAGVATAVAGIALSVTKLVTGSAEAADELSELSAKTGLSTTKLQELNFIGKQVGVGTETITGAMAKMIRTMSSARDGTGDAADAFKALGVPITDANGTLRDSQTVFSEALSALGKMTNETERDAMSMAIFGRSAMELNPLIKTSADEMSRMTEQAHELGAVVAEEDVAALGNFQDTLDGLKDGLKGMAGTVAATFLPAFEGIAGKATGYMKKLASVVSGSGGDIGAMAAGIGKLVGIIVSDIAREGPQMLQAGLGILQGIVTAIVSNLPTLLPAVISMITSLVNFIVQNLPMIITAALQIIIALANGLSQALPTLIPAIVAIIPQIVTTLLENLPLLILAAVQLILALAQGLIAALPVLIPEIPKIVQAIYDALITSLPLILVGALQLIVTLGNGIIQNLPMIWDAAVQTCQKFVDGINGMMSKIKDVGIEIVRGVWNGMFSMTEWYRSKVLGFFTSIVDSVKKSLGIHSASTVFAGIGENMAAGLGIGFERQFEQIQRSMSGAMGGLAGMASAYPATGSGSGGRTVNTSMGGIHITVNGNADAARVGRSSEQGVQSALRAVGLA